MDDTRQQEKGGLEDDMMGEGPTQAKHRAAEKDGSAQAPLIRARRSRPSESCIRDSGPPPPLRLKVERQGGSGIAFIVVDPGALIWTVGEVRPRFRTPPPPPPGLKVERQGGSGIPYGPLIWARESLPLGLARDLPWAHYHSKLRTSGFLTHSFAF
jgi:hypothetical protein